MPMYDCGEPECSECKAAFGPDRTKAVASYQRRSNADKIGKMPADLMRPLPTKYEDWADLYGWRGR